MKRLFLAALLLTPLAFASGVEARTAEPAVVVRMTDGLQFVPARVTVRVGQRVVWRTVGTIAHTVTAVRAKAAKPAHAGVPAGARAWDSGFVGSGRTYSRVFTVPGVYRYFCIPHEGARMVGTIVVTR